MQGGQPSALVKKKLRWSGNRGRSKWASIAPTLSAEEKHVSAPSNPSQNPVAIGDLLTEGRGREMGRAAKKEKTSSNVSKAGESVDLHGNWGRGHSARAKVSTILSGGQGQPGVLGFAKSPVVPAGGV